MNILIIGAGAIGCLVATRLAEGNLRASDRSGNHSSDSSEFSLTIAGRQSLVDAFEQQGGLCVTENEVTQTISNISPAASIFDAYKRVKVAAATQSDNFDFDLVIFTVKSYDTEIAAIELMREVQARGGKLPVVMSLQNGVGNEETLAEAGFVQIIAGSLTTPVSVLSSANIRIDKSNSAVGFAVWANENAPSTQPTIDRVSTWPFFNQAGRLFAASNFRVENYRSAQSLKWTKLIMNMMGNASSAILNQAPPEFFAEDELVDLEIDAWREALFVMHAARIEPINMGKYPFRMLAPLILRLPKSTLRWVLRKQVAGGRGGKMPSLHIDLHSGKKRSEVGWLNGAVVKLGEQLEIPTPINQLLTETVLSLLDDPESRQAWTGETKRLARSAEKYRRWSQPE